jgi:ABC-type cobalamin/Fe3+-siderophores transport system ATPase subunit
MIHLEMCNFSYGNKTVFENVNLSLSSGTTFIVGKNGSGKSTFLRIIGGWLKASGVSNKLGKIAYLPTSYQMNPHLTVKDLVEIYELDWNAFLKTRVFSALQLHELSSARPIGELSSGEIQRLLLALLLNQKADSLILDEPFNHLDWSSQSKLIEELKLLKYKHCLITTHDFQTALHFPDAHLLLVDQKNVHDLGPSKEALISEKFQKSFHFRTQIIDNPIDRTSILAIAEKK